MSIRERIFQRISDLNMSQKDFAIKTGIPQSTVSEWKTKKTNPTSDKIMVICHVLEVTPEWLLSGVEKEGKRGNEIQYIVIDKNTEIGRIVTTYNGLDRATRARLMGYMEAISENNKAD